MSFVDDTYQFMMLFIGIVLYAIQIFLPCYFGNKVATASNRLVFSIYSCPWYDMPVNARKMTIILMNNSYRTMFIGIAQFFRLTMEQFAKVSITYLQGRILE